MTKIKQLGVIYSLGHHQPIIVITMIIYMFYYINMYE